MKQQGQNNLNLKALAEESKLKQVDRRISVNAPTILIILNEILTVNTPVTMQQSPNVYLNWLACITNITGAKQHNGVTSLNKPGTCFSIHNMTYSENHSI